MLASFQSGRQVVRAQQHRQRLPLDCHAVPPPRCVVRRRLAAPPVELRPPRQSLDAHAPPYQRRRRGRRVNRRGRRRHCLHGALRGGECDDTGRQTEHVAEAGGHLVSNNGSGSVSVRAMLTVRVRGEAEGECEAEREREGEGEGPRLRPRHGAGREGGEGQERPHLVGTRRRQRELQLAHELSGDSPHRPL
eukprot:scaffold118565_cov63-Phaeocystis_antarctica.AAC.2